MERHPDLLGEGWDPRGVVLAKGRWEEGWGPRDGSSLETHLRSRAQGQDQEPSPGSHLTVRVKAGPSPLTMPSSARPEPMLIMVGMMSNFPACQDREKEKKCFCRGRERPLVPAGSDGGEPVAASYLPKHLWSGDSIRFQNFLWGDVVAISPSSSSLFFDGAVESPGVG